ncbi:hypothetical protein [Arenimonas sp.]|uniref:hypothetical protein n=1 Tax=Arenimonas sp. TaxID=1872635 RepID=UPI0039E64A0F
MRSILLLPVFLLCVAGCATGGMHPGWTGEGAEPFDGARDACRAQADAVTAASEREKAFEACMEARGWRRLGQ